MLRRINHQLIQMNGDWCVLASIDGKQESQEAICRFLKTISITVVLMKKQVNLVRTVHKVSTTLLISGYGTIYLAITIRSTHFKNKGNKVGERILQLLILFLTAGGG